MTEYLYGRRAVLEALRANRRRMSALLLAEGVEETDIIRDIVRLAHEHGLSTRRVPRQVLADLAHTTEHQGVALKAEDYPYVDVAAVFDLARARGEPPFLLVLDLLQDPQNVGALLRVAEGVGVHGVIIQERRAAEVTPAVVRASSGAVEHLNVAQVKNLVNAMRQLKEMGVWLVGMEAAPDAQPFDQANLSGAVGLVLGSEAKGLRRLVREHCDMVIQLPMRGQIASLNVATAGAVGLYAVWQARGWQGWRRSAGPEASQLPD